MSETLLSPSNVLLFGRQVDDLQIIRPPVLPLFAAGLASTANINLANNTPANIDGVSTNGLKRILLKDQNDPLENGLYDNNRQTKKLERIPGASDTIFVNIRLGTVNAGTTFEVNINGVVSVYNGPGDDRHGPFSVPRLGTRGDVELQLRPRRNPVFARIYAFSFEAYYYDLPRPVLFLVHGPGVPASEARLGGLGAPNRARAPGDPSLTGLGSADFQFAEDITVWSYDKADYTIRMDIETGMFEDVLLAAMLGGGAGGLDARGMQARGMQARGMQARGMQARGMQARGGGNSD